MEKYVGNVANKIILQQSVDHIGTRENVDNEKIQAKPIPRETET